MMKKTSVILALMAFFLCFKAQAGKLNTGPWRFEMRATHASIPFIITFLQKGKRISGVLQNGKETIKLNEIKQNGDALIIPLQTYEMTLEMKIEKKDFMTGFLVRHNKNPKIKTPVIGIHGETERFPEEKSKAKINLNGRWPVTIKDEEDTESSGILVFEQNKNKLYGSLLTPTGDYRFFEGFVSGTEFEAASFDGINNYIIRGQVKNGKLEASVLANHTLKLKGTQDNNASLPDAYKQTQLASLHFKFPNLEGKMVSLSDEKFKGKPVIIQFYGSWCPNCMDETNFLIPWYKNNKQRGVEVIALAFERSLNEKAAKTQLKKTIKKKRIPYTVLLAGSTSDDKPADKIKGLKNFISFPTTVFLNKNHEVVKVHAGFTGPSTGEFYEKWKSEFTQTVAELLK